MSPTGNTVTQAYTVDRHYMGAHATMRFHTEIGWLIEPVGGVRQLQPLTNAVTFTAVQDVDTNPNVAWDGVTTYYYRVYQANGNPWYGANSAEVSITPAVGQGGIILTIEGVTPNTLLAVVRGTATGTYVERMFIPASEETVIVVDQNTTANRVSWESGTFTNPNRGAYEGIKYSAVRGGRTEIYSDVTPAAGSWQVGDRIWMLTPAAGASPGWVCVTAGSGGAAVWKAMAALAV